MVNVGDLKGHEMATEFFLDYAWDPEAVPADALDDWERQWAGRQFSPKFADDIGGVLHDYAALQSDRKPELLNRWISQNTDGEIVYEDWSPFSLTNYRELERVTQQWTDLAERARRIGERLPDRYEDAYYELVLYRVAASANLYELRLAEYRNLVYAQQGRAATNALADEAEARFAEDQALMARYNTEIADGTWSAEGDEGCPWCRGFMNQAHRLRR